MAQPNEPIPSARVRPFLIPPQNSGVDILPLGLVEDVRFPLRYASELFRTIGTPYSPGGVVNFVEGEVGFTKVYQANDTILDILRPRIQVFTAFQSFGMLIMDPVDNRQIAIAVGCLPSQIEFNDRGGASPRFSYQGICQITLMGRETTEALASA